MQAVFSEYFRFSQIYKKCENKTRFFKTHVEVKLTVNIVQSI